MAERFLILDPKQYSVGFNPDGSYLHTNEYPACWGPSKEGALSFTQEEFLILCEEWPYLGGCKLVPVEDNPVIKE